VEKSVLRHSVKYTQNSQEQISKTVKANVAEKFSKLRIDVAELKK